MSVQETHSGALLQQLARNSTPYQDPLSRVRWELLDTASYWLPEAALSLYGGQDYARLTGAQRARVSQLEFLHLTQAGLWLESLFLERAGRTLLRPEPMTEATYRLHQMREEAGHSLMFLELQRRSGLSPWDNPYRQLRAAEWLGRRLPEHSGLYHLSVLVGEEVPDRVNRFVRRQAAQINPAIEDIVRIHLIDEARHIVHSKEELQRHPPGKQWWERSLVPLVGRLLARFIDCLFYPPAELYEQAGLFPGARWCEVARRNRARAEFVQDCVRPTLRTLRHTGITLRLQ